MLGLPGMFPSGTKAPISTKVTVCMRGSRDGPDLQISICSTFLLLLIKIIIMCWRWWAEDNQDRDEEKDVANIFCLQIHSLMPSCSATQSCQTLLPQRGQHTKLPCLALSPRAENLLKFMSIESVMLSKHFIFCRPLLPLPSVVPSIRAFSNESALRTRGQSIGALASASVLPPNI